MRGRIFFLILCLASSCGLGDKNDLSIGIWRGEITLQGQTLPFNFEVSQLQEKTYSISLINGEERITIDEVVIIGDSIFATMQVFDTQIRARIDKDKLDGFWIKNYESDHRYPFQATYDLRYRFQPNLTISNTDVTGKWEVQFSQDTSISIGIFEQANGKLTGTFLTTKGDYRFLEGIQSGQTLKLSTFDGAHAFLFDAEIQGDSSIRGTFYSSRAWQETWVAKRNEQVRLAHADSLTYLKDDYERLDFSFPDLNGKMLSPTDSVYKNKILILQIFGTWCPNCIDETKYLVGWYDKHKDRGVQIIGLAYEKKPGFDYARNRVNKMINELGVNYDFVIAGTSDKIAASKTLPMLNHVMAFPTTIFLDPEGQVERIHTGFTGPGTGHYYQQFMDQFNTTVDRMVSKRDSLARAIADSLATDLVQ